MSSKGNLLSAGPVKNYKPAKLPTLESACVNPLLEVLPARWKKNTGVIACLGLAGMLTVAGCSVATDNKSADAPYPVAYMAQNDTKNGYNDSEPYTPYNAAYQPVQDVLAYMQAQIKTSDVNLRIHWGGLGSGPFYVAYLTEHEVLGFIRAKLEVAGLNFDALPPDYTIFGMSEFYTFDGDFGEIRIELYDSENNVAVTSLDWFARMNRFEAGGHDLVDGIIERFKTQSQDTSFGVFYNPEKLVGWGPFHWDEDEENVQEVTPEKKEEARAELIECITAQVEEFIAWLQAEGIV